MIATESIIQLQNKRKLPSRDMWENFGILNELAVRNIDSCLLLRVDLLVL